MDSPHRQTEVEAFECLVVDVGRSSGRREDDELAAIAIERHFATDDEKQSGENVEDAGFEDALRDLCSR